MARFAKKRFIISFQSKISFFVTSSASQTHDWRPPTSNGRIETPTLLCSAMLLFWNKKVGYATESFLSKTVLGFFTKNEQYGNSEDVKTTH